ncbi:hypothetical protein D0T08_13335 [Emticicia sp. C21]|nr:hypothetical protein D0T08_13335 [Emticicia sp. C21]
MEFFHVPRGTEKLILTFGEKTSELISDKKYKTTEVKRRFSIKIKKDTQMSALTNLRINSIT